MLRLRVIAPVELREAVVGVLEDACGVAHLMLHPGAALEPPGAEITADVARDSVNDVIKALKELGVPKCGPITLEVLDTVLSSAAHHDEDEAEGDPADAVIWDELIARTREDATLSTAFVLFLTLACLLAAIGVVTDSVVTVVGAMVVGPEFGPLAALSVALVRPLVIGFPVAMAITASAPWVRAPRGG